MEDFRPHLLIPEPEVDYIDPRPVLGPKKQDVDHYEHGSVLSNGLQDIVSAYTKIQSADSLRDEDIRIFEILLPEGEKFSNKTLRDFLEAEGMSIASVHDEHRAQWLQLAHDSAHCENVLQDILAENESTNHSVIFRRSGFQTLLKNKLLPSKRTF